MQHKTCVHCNRSCTEHCNQAYWDCLYSAMVVAGFHIDEATVFLQQAVLLWQQLQQ